MNSSQTSSVKLVDMLYATQAKINKLQKEEKNLKEIIKSRCEQYGTETIETDQCVAKYYSQTRKSVSLAKMAEDTIALAERDGAISESTSHNLKLTPKK